MPLLGDSSPNVRMTERPLNPSLALAASGSTNGKSGMPWAMTSIFSCRHPDRRCAAVRGPCLAITTSFDGRLDDALHYRALDRAGRLGQHRVQCRDDRHGQARQQFENVGAGFAAENAEFVLQADDVEPAGVQEAAARTYSSMLSSLICNATDAG